MSNREDRVGEAVAWYFQAAESGTPPDRADFLARFPDLGPELESFLADKGAFDRAAGPPAPARYDPDATLPPANPNNDTATLPPADPNATIPRADSNPGAAANPDPSLGSIRYFGDYELLSEIARGGMGVVFRARQVSLNREVALKMILTGQLASSADVVRFRAEAEAAANLDHPNILPIYEVGEHQGQQYFAMKLVPGGSLAGKVGPWVGESRTAVGVFVKVCRAVDFAHRRGILHRDLKPGNILLDADGTPYVTDFGLAKKVDGDSNLTQSGAIVGTPSYMAPEQARAEKGLTTAADVYALGAILYELLTGQPPFRGPTVLDTILQVIEKEPADPRSVNPRADRDLSVIALKCLEKNPTKRYESAGALADDLDRWARGEPILAREVTRRERAVKWVKRNRTFSALAAGLIVTLVAGSVLSTLFAIRANEQKFIADEQKRIADRNAGEMNSARIDAERAKEAAQTERENAEDALCRSRFEEARALRLAGLPGWRTTGLARLSDAARLRTRPRQNTDDSGLLALADLRGEAIAALCRADADLVRTIPSGIADNPILSGDGKLVVSKFNRTKGSGAMIFGIRGLDLTTGAEPFSHEADLTQEKVLAPKTDAERVGSLNMITFLTGNLAVNSTGTLAVWNNLEGGELSVVETRTVKPLRTLQTGLGPNATGLISDQVFSPDDRRVLAWYQEPKGTARLLLWDLEGAGPAREVVRVPVPEEPKPDPKAARPARERHSCGFTPRGHIWYVPPDRRGIRALDPGANPPSEARHDIPDPIAVAWHPTAPVLAAVTQTDAKPPALVLWDCTARKELARRPLTMNRRVELDFYSVPFPMGFSRDGHFLAVRDDDTTVAVLDANTGRDVLRIPTGATDSISKLSWTCDNELFVKPIMEPIQLWRIAEDRAVRQGIEIGQAADVARISPDRRWWALIPARQESSAPGDPPRPAVLFDRDGSAGRHLPLPDKADIRSFRFRPDSRAVVVRIDNELVELSLPDGRELRRVTVPKIGTGARWHEPFYLPSGRLACGIDFDQVWPNPKTDPARPPVSTPVLTVWDVDRSGVLWENRAVTGERRMNSSCCSPDGMVLVVNPNESFFGGSFPAADREHGRQPMWVFDRTDGRALGRVPVCEEVGTETFPAGISADNRWAFVAEFSEDLGGQLALGGTFLRVHKLPGGEQLLRRPIRPPDGDRGGGGFAETLPVAAVLIDRATLELWRLEPRAELLARWQPYGGRPIADLGFTGDALYLRGDGQTRIDLVPLPELNRGLRTLGLGW